MPAGLLGFLNQLQILSIDAELAADNFLHLFSGLAAVAFGISRGAPKRRAADHLRDRPMTRSEQDAG